MIQNFKIKNIKFILCFILFGSLNSYGQSVPSSKADLLKYMKSPELADFTRYGKTPVSKHAGRLSLSIPLTSIEDETFSVPISLSYNSGGFMPIKIEGIVGVDWSINPIGIITRDVKGEQDDRNPKSQYVQQKYHNGFAYYVKKKGKMTPEISNTISSRFIGIWNNSGVINNFRSPSLYSYIEEDKKDQTIESTSDVYSFSVGEHSGRFMINFDGTASVTSDNGRVYKINLDNFHSDTFSQTASAPIIVITSDDGYKYTFGGTYDAIEYSSTLRDGGWVPFVATGFHYPSISSYHLTKIEAPNGKLLEVIYKSLPADFHLADKIPKLFSNSDKFIKNSHAQNYSLSYQWYAGADYSDQPHYKGNREEYLLWSLNKTVLVEQIKTSSQSIFFSYKNKETIENVVGSGRVDQNPYLFEIPIGAILTQINHTQKGAIDFTYKIWDGESQRTRLSRIESKEMGVYKFDYDATSGPSLFTKHIDHWNYFIGGNKLEYDKTSLMPKDEIRREPVAANANAGMLTKITYPTGGVSEFEYERHYYSQELIRHKSNKYIPSLISTQNLYGLDQKIAGGVRIKKIIDKSSDSTLPDNIREFIYKTNFNSKESSGILHFKPIYKNPVYLFTQFTNSGATIPYPIPSPYQYFFTDAAGFNPKSYEADHVTYSSVIELTYPQNDPENKYYTITEFTDYKKYPDILYNNDIIGYSYKGNDDNETNYIKNFRREMLDQSFMRGKISSESFYDRNNKIYKKDTYTYTKGKNISKSRYFVHLSEVILYQAFSQGIGQTPIFENFKMYAPSVQENVVELTPSLLTAKSTVDNSGSDPIIIYETFSYNENNYLSQTSRSQSNGLDIYTDYTYVSDGGSGMDYQMKNIGIVSKLRSSNTWEMENWVKTPISFKQINYTMTRGLNNQIFPVVESVQEGISNTNLRTTYKALDFTKIGQPIQIIDEKEQSIFYVWSYNGMYPIASIINTSKEEVESVFKKYFSLNLEDLSNVSIPNRDILTSGKIQKEFPNSLVTTYTHKPSIGINSITNHRGVTTAYDYKTHTRKLSRVIIKSPQDSVKVLKQYEYSFKNK